MTTARDQSTLGRAIQDRFPRYYRYFSTTAFNYHGHSIRNHNRLLGNVEGVDGIKTGYTRASGFNLVTSMRRGNRHLVGVVLGGRSGGSRDAIMRNLLAENLDKAATKRTVAAITERSASDANADVAEADAESQPTQMVQTQGAIQVASASPDAGRGAPGAFNCTGFTIDRRRCSRFCAFAEGRARPAHQWRDPNSSHRRNSRFVRTDEARQGEDRPGQSRSVEAGLGRFVPAGHTCRQYNTAGTSGSSGDIKRRRGQSRN